MKKFVPFRLSKNSLDCLEELKKMTGNNKTQIVEQAIEIYFVLESDKHRRLYSERSHAILNERREVF